MKNQRRQPRYPLKTAIQAINVIDGRSLGILTNLSAGGFLLMCGREGPKRGDIYQLHLLDPKAHSLDIMVGATCAWREEAHATNSFWCGFKFIDVSPEAQQALDRFLETLAKHD